MTAGPGISPFSILSDPGDHRDLGKETKVRPGQMPHQRLPSNSLACDARGGLLSSPRSAVNGAAWQSRAHLVLAALTSDLRGGEECVGAAGLRGPRFV